MKRVLVLGAILVTTAGFIVGAGLYWPKKEAHRLAVQRCRDAIDAFPADAGTYDILRVVWRECAAMVNDEQCRNSMDRAGHSSAVETSGIALAGCRAEYCAGAAGVEICARQEYESRQEEALAGAQLVAAIFAREGGAEAAALAEALYRSKARIPPIPLHVTAEPPSTLDVRIEISNEDPVTLVIGDGGVLATLPVSELGTFLTGKPDLVAARFALHASSNVEHLRVIAVLDGLKQAGAHRIAFSTSNARLNHE
jgi:biopolymer transport protein ExbD